MPLGVIVYNLWTMKLAYIRQSHSRLADPGSWAWAHIKKECTGGNTTGTRKTDYKVRSTKKLPCSSRGSRPIMHPNVTPAAAPKALAAAHTHRHTYMRTGSLYCATKFVTQFVSHYNGCKLRLLGFRELQSSHQNSLLGAAKVSSGREH